MALGVLESPRRIVPGSDILVIGFKLSSNDSQSFSRINSGSGSLLLFATGTVQESFGFQLPPAGLVLGAKKVFDLILKSIVRRKAVAIAKYIINIDSGGGLVEYVKELQARGARVCERTTEVTFKLLHRLTYFSRIKGMPVSHLQVGRRRIILPVGDTVSDHDTSERWLECASCSLLVVLVDLVHQIWDVDSSIGLTREVEVIYTILRELGVPTKEYLQIVFS